MRITVRLLASYRRFLPDDHDDRAGFGREVAPGSRVSDVLAGLTIPAGDAFTCLVNGRHADRTQVLQPAQQLSVFPAVGGG
jgi:sulfur carrier protein ThiS